MNIQLCKHAYAHGKFESIKLLYGYIYKNILRYLFAFIRADSLILKYLLRQGYMIDALKYICMYAYIIYVF